MLDDPAHDRPITAFSPRPDPQDPDAPATPSKFRRLTARIEDFQRRLAAHRTALDTDDPPR